MSDNTIPISRVENSLGPTISAGNTGTVINVTVFDPGIADVIAAGFDKLILERSTDLGLTYAQVTGAPTPSLTSDVTTYSIRDRAGDVSYYYRTRYVSTQGPSQGECSDPSEPILGAGLAIKSILTVAELKANYLFGVDITDTLGRPFSDASFTHYILTAIRWMEHELDISIIPTSFTDLQDYYANDYGAFNFIRLDNYPVISVEEFRVQYPSGQNVVVFPPEWYRLNKAEGHLQIVPTAGTLSEMMIGQGGSFLPAVYNGMAYLPQLFHVDYTAGFEEGKVPRDLLDAIGMFASMGPLSIFGDLLGGAGIASSSISLDGLSQSINTTSSAENSGYSARVDRYEKMLRKQMPLLRSYFKGIRFTVA